MPRRKFCLFRNQNCINRHIKHLKRVSVTSLNFWNIKRNFETIGSSRRPKKRYLKTFIQVVRLHMEFSRVYSKLANCRVQKLKLFSQKFPRLKIIASDISEIWSIVVSCVDKLVKYNSGVEYLLVAVALVSRFFPSGTNANRKCS